MEDGIPQVRGGHATPLLLGERWVATTTRSKRLRSLSMPGLVAIIYYSVAGGPFGTEDVISAAGPLLGLLGFLLMPAVWSVPEALVAAELATAFPSNGGYVTWVTAAFGPFWGFIEGFLSWISGVSDNSIYPVLFCDYLKHVIPATEVGLPRIQKGWCCIATRVKFPAVCRIAGHFYCAALRVCCPNLSTQTGAGNWAHIQMPDGESAGCVPWQHLHAFGRPELHEMDWQKYLILDRTTRNVLFWNLNYWDALDALTDSASTLAGEVLEPRRVFPQALFLAMVLVIASYVLPLLVGIGMTTANAKLEWRNWRSGTLSVVGLEAGGRWVKIWVVVAAAASNIGQFTCEQAIGWRDGGSFPALCAAANAFQLEGMADARPGGRGMMVRNLDGYPSASCIVRVSGPCGVMEERIEPAGPSYSPLVLTELPLLFFQRILSATASTTPTDKTSAEKRSVEPPPGWIFPLQPFWVFGHFFPSAYQRLGCAREGLQGLEPRLACEGCTGGRKKAGGPRITEITDFGHL
ncbi:unnamed protein product [Cladocopium goreaui]|uniref:Probable polyamine transporter At1g31830 n=1 Tax=Cladocopium goreaui TaxID=2562237 RepID=A0A9P1M414_9DINO|nr:unnamed protein product [Cladocopium goreaui]